MALYDHIGITYSTKRQTDPRIAAQLNVMLERATRILNIGAGAGFYEPDDVDLVAVEPSDQMIAQRSASAYPAVRARAESLPFEDNAFSHVMSVLSMHHWHDQAKAFGEINRVARQRFVALTWDPSAAPFWLTRDYFPQIYETDLGIFPPLELFVDHFDEVQVLPLMIPHDCRDGFLAAYWQRPEAYLDPMVRKSISTFAKLANVQAGLQKLEADLNSGAWAETNAELAGLTQYDAGYRIISARVRKE